MLWNKSVLSLEFILQNRWYIFLYTCSVSASPPGGYSESDTESLNKATHWSTNWSNLLTGCINLWSAVGYNVIKTLFIPILNNVTRLNLWKKEHLKQELFGSHPPSYYTCTDVDDIQQVSLWYHVHNTDSVCQLLPVYLWEELWKHTILENQQSNQSWTAFKELGSTMASWNSVLFTSPLGDTVRSMLNL